MSFWHKTPGKSKHNASPCASVKICRAGGVQWKYQTVHRVIGNIEAYIGISCCTCSRSENCNWQDDAPLYFEKSVFSLKLYKLAVIKASFCFSRVSQKTPNSGTSFTVVTCKAPLSAPHNNRSRISFQNRRPGRARISYQNRRPSDVMSIQILRWRRTKAQKRNFLTSALDRVSILWKLIRCVRCVSPSSLHHRSCVWFMCLVCARSYFLRRWQVCQV